MTQVIDSFRGKYAFLSNFYACPVVFEGVAYPTSEHAFQAAKTQDVDWRLKILAASTPGKAKRLGKKVPLRAFWPELRVEFMYMILMKKFANPELQKLLLETGDAKLVEGNDWGDTYWGVCNGVGQNMLGKVLEEVRASYRKEV